jgi:hypothetical protein
MKLLLKNSHPQKEGVLAVSKWNHLPLLLSNEEMQSLLSCGGYVFPIGRIISAEEMSQGKESFLENYSAALQAIFAAKPMQNDLTYAITTEPDDLYSMPVKNEKYLIRQRRPVIQSKKHQFILSADHSEILQNVCGEKTIPWGVQLSFPRLYQDPISMEVIEARGDNWGLFRAMQKWVRHNTIPTPFLIDGKKKNSTLRLGKQSVSWINQHPGLILSGIKVYND